MIDFERLTEVFFIVMACAGIMGVFVLIVEMLVAWAPYSFIVVGALVIAMALGYLFIPRRWLE